MNLKERLQRLLALTSSPEENEARTAAHLLVKTCRENGVTIRFVLPKRLEEKPAPPPVPASSAQSRVPFDDLVEFLRAVQGAGVGPSSPFGIVSCPKCGFPLIRGASCPMCARGAPPSCPKCRAPMTENALDGWFCSLCRMDERKARAPAPPEPAQPRVPRTPEEIRDAFRRYGGTDPGYYGVDAARKRYRGR